MPSKVELDLIYQNLVFGKTDKYNFNGKSFWSSLVGYNDYGYSWADILIFSKGGKWDGLSTRKTCSVRAVRAFSIDN